MKRKRTYQSVDLKDIQAALLLAALAALSVGTGSDAMGCIIALDVAKHKFFAGVANMKGELVRIIRFEHPTQTELFLGLMQELRTGGAAVQVAMEPTGTYGDAIREQCYRLGFPVYMVSPKHTHDMAEVFDGVPSQHDAKSAALVAQVHAMGKSKLYEPDAEDKREMRATLDLFMMYQSQLDPLYGRLEALLAKYWPEFGQWIDVRQQRSWMKLIEELPGPEAVSQSQQMAVEILRKASRGALPKDKVNGLIQSACESVGVQMNAAERRLLSELAAEIRRVSVQCHRVHNELESLVAKDPMLARIAKVVGPALAAALLSYLGDPNKYNSAAAYAKACGLNLKIKESGEKKGQLKITKRGPGEVRRLLFLAVGRLIQSDRVTQVWYEGRKAYEADQKTKAMVAVMRKLIRALWHVARGAEFDSTKLFDTRRLQLENDDKNTSPSCPETSRKAGVRTSPLFQRRTLSVQEVQAP